MFYRCKSCGDFYWVTLLAMSSCEHCDFIAIRCKECGGQEAAELSVKHHVAWYLGKKAKKLGYRDIHNPDYEPSKKLPTPSKDLLKFLPKIKANNLYI